MSFKLQIGKAKVFSWQNYSHITNEDDFRAFYIVNDTLVQIEVKHTIVLNIKLLL